MICNFIEFTDIRETFVDYKKTGLYVSGSRCNLKCKECFNENLKHSLTIKIKPIQFVEDYIIKNQVIESVIFSGLNWFDKFEDLLQLVNCIRVKTDIDIVIYTGYKESEVLSEIDMLKENKNIIVKFGEYIPNDMEIYDEVLGITLASSNQYAKKIS